MAQYDAMWETGNLDVRRKLVDEEQFLKNLTDAHAKDIISVNDTQMLKSIAEWSELFYPDESDAEQAAHLSGSMADAVLTHISTHSDSSVRAALVGNLSAPAKFLPPVRRCVEQGMSRHIRLASMTADDSQALSHASLDTVLYVAENIEEILDKIVRRTVATALIKHPDPSVRLALAENGSAPAYVVKDLLNDPDIDVAATARKELNDSD